MKAWRAGCGESRTSGSEGGPERPTDGNVCTALRSDPYTYIRTWEGWLYLAVVLDLFSRRVVGWALANHLRSDLAVSALQMAVRHRQPPRGMIQHSDRGVQYASREYQAFLKRHGIEASMSRKGDCWDNAVVESFFGTLKTESLHRLILPTRAHARWAVIDYITNFYNPRRRHSTLGNLSPLEFETRARATQSA